MNKFLLLVISILSLHHATGQTANSFNLLVGAGPSYFFNDPSLARRVDNTILLGVNYEAGDKKRSFILNPGLRMQINDYHAHLQKNNRMHVTQHTGVFSLDVLMRMSKKSYMRVGLFYGRVLYSSVQLSYKDYSSTAYFGSTELEQGYYEARNQTGFNAGVSFPFRFVRRIHKFSLTIHYTASRLVSSDYHVTKAQAGQDVKVLSAKARPFMLVFSLDLNSRRLKKKESSEE